MSARTRLRHRAPLAASAALFALATACSDITAPPTPNLAVTAAAPVRDPILFVHGWNANATTWATMVANFKADGYTDQELVNWSYNYRVSNATTASLINAKVDSMLAATGASKVDIITHSMGSLSARYYIKKLRGERKVDAFVSLGGPNHGTQTAFFCGDKSCVEMRPGSTFLNQLNAKDETPGTPRYATWWTSRDNVILPQSSTALSGATNTQTADIDHSALHEDYAVYEQVRAWVNPALSPFVASR